MDETMTDRAVVIGAGPAGLMAAQELALAGLKVTLLDTKPSPARKFLMAGKSGLNITNAKSTEDFLAHLSTPALAPMIKVFGPAEVQNLCSGLGQELFTGSSGRVFPVAMKASPLLRAWLSRLQDLGVTHHWGWRFTGFEGSALRIEGPQGHQLISPKVVVLALGGGSWPRLGSDGAWANLLEAQGVTIAPFKPANMGFLVGWSAHMTPFFGKALKSVALRAGTHLSRGELVLSRTGIEGGGIYSISAPLRDGAKLTIDLKPDVPMAKVVARLAKMRVGESLSSRLRKLGLSDVAAALVMEFGRNAHDLAALIKNLPIPLLGPRHIDQAISTAGGITWSSLGPDLSLKVLPNIFACGEMLDWEAPTGGYLLTTCLSTGQWAGRAAAKWAKKTPVM